MSTAGEVPQPLYQTQSVYRGVFTLGPGEWTGQDNEHFGVSVEIVPPPTLAEQQALESTLAFSDVEGNRGVRIAWDSAVASSARVSATMSGRYYHGRGNVYPEDESKTTDRVMQAIGELSGKWFRTGEKASRS